MHRPNRTRGEQSLGKDRPEGVRALGTAVVGFVTLTGKRPIEFESHPTGFRRSLHGDGNRLTHAAPR